MPQIAATAKAEENRIDQLTPPTSLSVRKEQPIGVLLVDLVVDIGNRLDTDMLEDRTKCVGKWRTFRVGPDRQDAVGG